VKVEIVCDRLSYIILRVAGVISLLNIQAPKEDEIDYVKDSCWSVI
jgi:hypothetical protein